MIKEIIKKIEENDKIAIFHHQNIDGDSWSSSYGLLLGLRKKYPNKEIVWMANEEELKNNFPFLKYEKEYVIKNIDDTFLAIIGDTSSINKMSSYDQFLKAKERICFDHHRNDINIEHDLFWHEPEYPASAMQAYEILKKLDIEFDEEIAFNVLIGLLTDTGNFTYSLGNNKPPKYFANLLEYVSDDKMNKFWNNMKSRKIEDIKIQKIFLNNLQFKGKVAYVIIDEKITSEFNDDVNFKLKINLISNIEGYPIWAVFIIVGNELRLHFRSNGPNVSKVAINHGGGGHIRAAGAKVDYSSDSIKNVLQELNNVV